MAAPRAFATIENELAAVTVQLEDAQKRVLALQNVRETLLIERLHHPKAPIRPDPVDRIENRVAAIHRRLDKISNDMDVLEEATLDEETDKIRALINKMKKHVDRLEENARDPFL